MREVTLDRIDDLVTGALVHGAGGGGDGFTARQLLHAAIDRHGPVPLVGADELEPAALVLPVASAGTPYSLREKLHSTTDAARLRALVEARAGRECAAVLPVQPAAVNGTLPVMVAAHLGLPCLDADVMGRCLPMLSQTLFRLAGFPVSPITAVGSNGVLGEFTAGDDEALSALMRSLLPGMGLVGLVSAYRVTAGDCARHAARGTLSRCARVGAALRAVQQDADGDHSVFLEAIGGRIVFTGPAVELVQHSRGDGVPRGVLSIESARDPGRLLRLDFQNENLVATVDGEVLVSLPDLVNLIDAETATALQTVDVTVGQWLHVVASPVDERWHSPEGLALVGPRAFGYDIDPVRA